MKIVVFDFLINNNNYIKKSIMLQKNQQNSYFESAPFIKRKNSSK